VCRDEFTKWREKQPGAAEPDLRLFLGGWPMPGPVASPKWDVAIEEKHCPSKVGAAFRFVLDPRFVADKDHKASWIRLLESPWLDQSFLVSVGTEGKPWPGNVQHQFERLNTSWFWVWAVAFLVLLAVFLKWAATSGVLRDGAKPENAYSLGRVQMAGWTILIAASLAFLFMVTWNENVIPTGALVLMGISFGSSLLAAQADGGAQFQKSTGNFIKDLLESGNGPEFHRFQMILFTIILMVIFVVKVANTLVMPEFDATLLALMGISSGAYIGFKLREP
jgi:hypothetical protein